MATLKMEEDERGSGVMEGIKSDELPKTNGFKIKQERSTASATPNRSDANSPASSVSPEDVKPGSESASTPDQGPQPKISRKASHKVQQRPAMLFDHLPDATEESCKNFQVINDCLYGSKHMGASQHDALDCDCAEEWRKFSNILPTAPRPGVQVPRLTQPLIPDDGKNHACGEDSDCINRATKMECVDRDCNCGDGCQNQRFQKKQYAQVSVIKTEKKGYGLRADTPLQANDFIFEYIGEVINEPTFRRRMVQYDDEGIKHFYFMSLTKSEFVDATKKGNLGRFCNHSCSPNCYVDKWVVGDKLRMGIFAGRSIRAGEELVFNYNVDRYGADPQPCYCGEPNCTGYIGGKTQTERATKLPKATIEALGIDDADSWDTAVAKKVRKKKATEDDEDYVNSVQPRGLDEAGVTKVMAALMQCKEKWIAVKLLSRIQQADDDRVRHQVVRMHGYQILKTTLDTFMDDTNVVLQILNILYQLPRLTKNKIIDAKIEGPIERLASSDHQDVSFESKRLLDVWSKLETAYRIPRKKHDSSAPPAANSFDERRNMTREEEAKPDPFANIVIPKGPRSNIPQRNASFFAGPPRPRKPAPTNIPAGWSIAKDHRGETYYYNSRGETTWSKPTVPAVEVPSAISKKQEVAKQLQEIIDNATKERTPRPSASQTPQHVSTPTQIPKKEKWRSLSTEKQQRLYENTVRLAIYTSA
jgi:histone-lysine N-methyltransferase SETD2